MLLELWILEFSILMFQISDYMDLLTVIRQALWMIERAHREILSALVQVQ